jgi:hypothetical protein
MFWRIAHTARRERELDEAEEPAPEAEGEPERREKVALDPRLSYTQNRASHLVAEEDQELLAYNEYLAQLADRERRHAG